MANGVLVGGIIHPLLHPLTGEPIPVLGPQDHHIEFKPGDGYNKKRVKPIDAGVIHWTGSENAVEQMAKTLRERKLGVEYAIAPYGVLYQFCDAMFVDTADAGILNSRSWGVEMVNAGFRRAGTLWRAPQYRKVPMGPREAYDTMIHGEKMKCWDFYPAQKATLFALNKLMTKAIATYPTTVHVHPGVLPDFKTAKGAMGHFNITTAKYDPGPRIMQELHDFMTTDALPLAVA